MGSWQLCRARQEVGATRRGHIHDIHGNRAAHLGAIDGATGDHRAHDHPTDDIHGNRAAHLGAIDGATGDHRADYHTIVSQDRFTDHDSGADDNLYAAACGEAHARSRSTVARQLGNNLRFDTHRLSTGG